MSSIMRDECTLSPSPSNDRLEFEPQIAEHAYVWSARMCVSMRFSGARERGLGMSTSPRDVAAAGAHAASASIDLKHRFSGVSATLRGAHWLVALRTCRASVSCTRAASACYGRCAALRDAHVIARSVTRNENHAERIIPRRISPRIPRRKHHTQRGTVLYPEVCRSKCASRIHASRGGMRSATMCVAV